MSDAVRRGWLAAVIWLVMAGGGSLLLMRFETRASEVGAVPARWPAESRIGRDGDRPTLVMFLHPNCPCSKASLHELRAVLQAASGRSTPRLVFVLRTAAGIDWRASKLRQDAASIPGAVLIDDQGGREAARFGAQTSGMALLYDRSGALRFQGGITAGRGHEGANPAEDMLLARLTASAGTSQTPVFGCSLESTKFQEAEGVKTCAIR